MITLEKYINLSLKLLAGVDPGELISGDPGRIITSDNPQFDHS